METKIDSIISNLLTGKKISSEDQYIFDRWLEISENKKYFHDILKLNAAIRANKKSQNIDLSKAWKNINRQIKPQRSLFNIFHQAAVVLLLLGVGISAFFLSESNQKEEKADSTIVTSANKQVTLTLSDGKQIPLSDNKFEVVKEQGIIINNIENQLIYNSISPVDSLIYNTITVPRGAEYVLTLSDSTMVWLNSDSKITYPVAFNHNTREVKLEGEAFFEVKKNTQQPFIVHTDEFDVRVTGTQFNVRNYPDDAVSATLSKGRIQIEKGDQINPLQPGQQAVLINNQIEIKQVDLSEVIAWHYEAFCFKQRRLENIMNELSRWFDIEIFYLNPEVRDYHFTAWFRRSCSISEIIEILEKTQKVKMQLKGKTLTVQLNHVY